jgi:hypothetical protein
MSGAAKVLGVLGGAIGLVAGLVALSGALARALIMPTGARRTPPGSVAAHRVAFALSLLGLVGGALVDASPRLAAGLMLSAGFGGLVVAPFRRSVNIVAGSLLVAGALVTLWAEQRSVSGPHQGSQPFG